ncbi:oligoribonuclease [Candidatus Synchoanobacter obligatus]|uniref:Oligoribonuclease n=1 Tax=Candidatus Synchoanobacter obligatus TaxID=2919597 RepID=A0ABT1L3H9_9GAMM|nr:oligoribonuclease [Candidatus Synchoanobacter obligatus]
MTNEVWVWLDLEMTGLNVEVDQILEVSCILTTTDLSVYSGVAFSEVVHYGEDVLEGMSDWCIEHHGNSGLSQAVRESHKSLAEVEKKLIEYIQSQTLPTNVLYLAGNSIHTDRAFVKRYMPGLESILHYRMLDVTAIAMFAYSMGIPAFEKRSSHRALDDIKDSIQELRHYKDRLGRAE